MHSPPCWRACRTRLTSSDALGRALARRRAKRSPGELDRSRPARQRLVVQLRDRRGSGPGRAPARAPARRIALPAIEPRANARGSAAAAQTLRASVERDHRLRLTDDAGHALTEVVRAPATRATTPLAPPAFDVELRRDRAGPRLDPDRLRARAARTGAGNTWARSSCSTAPAGPWPSRRSRRWRARSRSSRASSTCGRSIRGRALDRARHDLARNDRGRRPTRGAGVPASRRQRAPAERAATSAREPCPGGASLPLTLDSWQRSTPSRCEAGSATPRSGAWRRSRRGGRRRRPCSSCPRSTSEPSFVLAPGHDARDGRELRTLRGAWRPQEPSGAATRTPAAGDPRRSVLGAGPRPFISDNDPLGGARRAGRAAADPGGARPRRRAGGALRRDRRRPGGPPRPWRRAEAVPARRGQYLLKQRRSFLADEQGLGKTIEALATIEADGAYPGDRRMPGQPEAQLDAGDRALAAGALGADARRHSRGVRGRPT